MLRKNEIVSEVVKVLMAQYQPKKGTAMTYQGVAIDIVDRVLKLARMDETEIG